MKKLRLLLALLVANMCAVQNAWADRVAPELPEAQTLVSGTTYYLYNVLEGKFACHSTTAYDYPGLGTYGDKVAVTATENEGEYTIKWASNNYYWWAYDTYVSSNSYSYGSYDYFTISVSSNGYTIQRSTKNTGYYKADEFLGYDGSNGDRLSPALTGGSIHWQLIAVDDAEHYFAKHKLYTYLNVADQYNFYINQYDDIYNDPASTTAELDQAQIALKNALDLSQNYVSPEWTEYPILFQNTTNDLWGVYNSGFSWNATANGEARVSTLTATVNVDNDATLAYNYYTSSPHTNLRVYLDGELVQEIQNGPSTTYYWISDFSDGYGGKNRRYYVELTPGKHTISWTCQSDDSRTGGQYNSCYLNDIGVQNTPTITPATTTVEGQLLTEVLKLVDPVSSVRKIVISGIIGNDDWTTIGLMKNAFSIDMSEATTTTIPASMFTKDKFPFLHNVKLPQGLTSIGERAFENSDIEGDVTFPATLTSIGDEAFYHTKITSAMMQEGITNIGRNAYGYCFYLEQASWPSTATVIPYGCFNTDYSLRTFTIPEGVTEIGGSAFFSCWNFNPRFPSTMKSIGSSAFEYTSTDELVVTEGMTVNQYAFRNCGNLLQAEWPTGFAVVSSSTDAVVNNCSNLTTVKLKSPTVVSGTTSFFNGNDMGNITLLVPDFLVAAYKGHPYWSQCKVEGFNSAEITDWQVSQPLVLMPGQRIGGTPNLTLYYMSQLTVNGDEPQTIGNMSIDVIPVPYQWYNGSYNVYYGNLYNFMLSYTNNVNITGELSENIYTDDHRWYFLTLPFDVRVGDITAKSMIASEGSTSFAIRYYDGAARANNGIGGNWKNYSADDIIPAGTGFIYQTVKDAISRFVAQNNSVKQNILSNREFVKTLAENPSEVAANKGWNLIGNPWQTYYNIHKMNFTAPITVWDMNNRNYVAYSIIDDDYAIKPLEAIFVQCPDDLNQVTFPVDGRQLTDVIESQSGARADRPSERKLIDVELSNGEQTDKTRFVLNPQASLSYETNCDASKFMSMDAAVPQIYTIEQGTQMAINERPMGNGTVQIGFKVSQSGTYTISAPRCQFENITLVDNETGIETDLANSDYTFNANAGQNDNRFVLRVSAVVITSVESLNTQQSAPNEYYNLNGQRIAAPQKGLYIVNGKKVMK